MSISLKKGERRFAIGRRGSRIEMRQWLVFHGGQQRGTLDPFLRDSVGIAWTARVRLPDGSGTTSSTHWTRRSAVQWVEGKIGGKV
jgi:hypothetical protein